MSIQSVGSSMGMYNTQKRGSVNFGESQTVQNPEQAKNNQAEVQKKKGGWGYAVASGLITGLGQFCQGRTAAGFAQLGSAIGLGFLGRAAITFGLTCKNKAAQTASFCVGALAGLGALGTGIYSMVDAYKGGKKD